ncbi:MAG: thioredoxin fold domain-containing protein [Planctomycetota bacterium]|jgi:thioredoxin 1
MQEQAENKRNDSSSYILLYGLAVIIVAGIAFHFWPRVKNFWPTATAAVVSDKYVSLTGIIYSQDNPMAIVEGKIVHQGDTIGDVKVLKIHKDRVEFEKSGRTWNQSMSAVKEGVTSGLPVLLELGSHKCPPCRKMMPILDELRADYAGKFQIRYIDVWQDRAAGAKYGVRAIPTQIFYDSQGTELYRHTGFLPKKDILAAWKSLGVKF